MLLFPNSLPLLISSTPLLDTLLLFAFLKFTVKGIALAIVGADAKSALHLALLHLLGCTEGVRV